MGFDTATTALVLVEFQKQWTDPGLYHTLIRRQLDAKAVLTNIRALCTAARASGVAVVHAPLIIDPGHKRGWLAHLTRGRIFTKGSGRSLLNRLFPLIFGVIGKPPEEAAKTAIRLASDPSLAGVSGRAFYDEHEVATSARAKDVAAQQRLWQLSAELTGLTMVRQPAVWDAVA